MIMKIEALNLVSYRVCPSYLVWADNMASYQKNLRLVAKTLLFCDVVLVQ